MQLCLCSLCHPNCGDGDWRRREGYTPNSWGVKGGRGSTCVGGCDVSLRMPSMNIMVVPIVVITSASTSSGIGMV